MLPFCYLSLVGESWKGEVRMQGEKQRKIKQITLMVAVQGEDRKHYLSCRGVLQQFKKVTIEDRMKNLISQEVTAGNF